MDTQAQTAKNILALLEKHLGSSTLKRVRLSRQEVLALTRNMRPDGSVDELPVKRKIIRNKTHSKYSQIQKANAIRWAISNKTSLYKAAKKFNLPITTLYRYAQTRQIDIR